jgi:hypothetical protein
MALKLTVIAAGMIATASPLAATAQEPPASVAPAGTPQTKYCMHIEAVTGTRLEEVKCWTREEWAEQGVDVDLEWAKEGVRIIEA